MCVEHLETLLVRVNGSNAGNFPAHESSFFLETGQDIDVAMHQTRHLGQRSGDCCLQSLVKDSRVDRKKIGNKKFQTDFSSLCG